MTARRPVCLALALCLLSIPVWAKKKEKDESPFKPSTFSGLALREIGPALTSGRVSDIAVHPRDKATWLITAASGGVWKTVNAGTTWTPVFDDEGSYSIGCITIDPSDPLHVWVGTGENNSQRSVSYGDGVYKSIDGGQTWENVGLVESEHIGKILVDPRDSNIVWVAAQGPLWGPGGDRGLYKTMDGGATWEASLEISENTGVTDVALDPRNPDVLYAASYQRRRRTWTLIDGGPESGIYKTRDGGASWVKLERGLPEVDLGRIGLAVSPVDPDVVYAIVEAERDEGGFFRSTDAGATWKKMSDYVAGSPQYYQEIVADPKKLDRVYSLDTWMMVTENGGESFQRVGNSGKHVDDHALWIDPDDTDHLLAGCDGGVYESWERGRSWDYKANLPITQFYKIAVDNDEPFYNVYGGTQDNFTLGGPSRSTSTNGLVNSDWFVTLGGDGFDPAVDPDDPNIVYSQYQYGGLARFDRKSGESVDIQPQVGPEEDAPRWNWDAALIISPHDGQRLYYASQRVFRSDDRGDTWNPISGDLTRALDRNELETMGRIQKADAVARGDSTSYYGNIVILSESPLVEGLLYAGTDDGLIQVLEEGQWREIEEFPGVAELAYVSDVEASHHESDRVYAVFEDHKSADFAPYLLRSDDRGRSWKSIVGNLPERGSAYTIAEDHVNADLLFVGTEFGVFFTVDGGERWTPLDGGIPVIAVRDLEIQRRESDLVAGTFGRGIWILDDYTPLRRVNDELLDRDAALFPMKDARLYMTRTPLGVRGVSFQGDSYFTRPNPEHGAVITYYLEEGMKTLREQRLAKEKERDEAEELYEIPSLDALRAERREEEPAIIITVKDAGGNLVRRMIGGMTAGFHRVTWDLRYPPSRPATLDVTPPGPFSDPPQGPMAAPGEYSIEVFRRVDGELESLAGPRPVKAYPAGFATLEASDKLELLEFQRKVARLQAATLGAVGAAADTRQRLDLIQAALMNTADLPEGLDDRVRQMKSRLEDLRVELSGDPTMSEYNVPQRRSIRQRVERIVTSQWWATAPPTQTSRDAYGIAGSALEGVLEKMRNLVDVDMRDLEKQLEQLHAPWTPGRVPRWTME